MIKITEMEGGRYKMEAELTEDELRDIRHAIATSGFDNSIELHDELNFAMEIVHLEY